MSTSARQLPGETGRVTRAIFEHASLISREQQLEELVRLNADAWAAGAEQYDDMTVAGLRVRG
jgi:hypothetical protein